MIFVESSEIRNSFESSKRFIFLLNNFRIQKVFYGFRKIEKFIAKNITKNHDRHRFGKRRRQKTEEKIG